MYPYTPPPKGWSSRHDLSQKQLVPAGDDNHYEMRYPPSQPKDISADSFSVSATLAAGGNLQPAGNLFSINPLTITESHETALEEHFALLGRNDSGFGNNNSESTEPKQEQEPGNNQ